MSIKVIKHGERKFKTVCPVCGCEFEYEIEDINRAKDVKCPECGNFVKHRELNPQKTSWEKETPYDTAGNASLGIPCPPITENPWDKKRMFYVDLHNPSIVWTSSSSYPDCATCPDRPEVGKVITGDTACALCKKNQVNW